MSRDVDPLREYMNQYSIEKKVPIPERKRCNRSKYPLRSMEVGDSFFVPCDEKQESAIRSTITSNARRIGIRVSLRKLEEDGALGIRVWRVE